MNEATALRDFVRGPAVPLWRMRSPEGQELVCLVARRRRRSCTLRLELDGRALRGPRQHRTTATPRGSAADRRALARRPYRARMVR